MPISPIHKRGIFRVALALVCVAVCVFNWARLSGLEYGFFYGVFETPRSPFGDGPNHFSTMNVWYFKIVCLFCAYLVVCFLAKWRASAIVRIGLLSIGLFPFFNMLDYKTATYGMDLPYYHYYGLKESYFFDWGCVVLIVVLMVIEIVSLRFPTSETSRNVISEP